MAGKRRITGRILSALDLPRETDHAVPRVTMVGYTDLLIENHAGICKCLQDSIRLNTEQGMLLVCGERMTLMELGKERVYIRGRIRSIAFENTEMKGED